MSFDWNSLLAIAQKEIKEVIGALPPQLRTEAETLPVTYDSRRDEDLRTLDLDGTLGLFVGASHLNAMEDAEIVPPQIILFLVNIWRFADRDESIYRREVRTTYMHELGHFLGLEEIDLEERGL